MKDYEANTGAYNVNRAELDEAKLELLKAQLCSKPYGFLVNVKQLGSGNAFNGPFQLCPVITDFYLGPNEVDEIK